LYTIVSYNHNVVDLSWEAKGASNARSGACGAYE